MSLTCAGLGTFICLLCRIEILFLQTFTPLFNVNEYLVAADLL